MRISSGAASTSGSRRSCNSAVGPQLVWRSSAWLKRAIRCSNVAERGRGSPCRGLYEQRRVPALERGRPSSAARRRRPTTTMLQFSSGFAARRRPGRRSPRCRRTGGSRRAVAVEVLVGDVQDRSAAGRTRPARRTAWSSSLWNRYAPHAARLRCVALRERVQVVLVARRARSDPARRAASSTRTRWTRTTADDGCCGRGSCT